MVFDAVAFDSSGNLYASNANDNTITEFNSSGAFVKSISGNLNGPVGVAFDSSGDLYASNLNNNTITEFNSSGVFVDKHFEQLKWSFWCSF